MKIRFLASAAVAVMAVAVAAPAFAQNSTYLDVGYVSARAGGGTAEGFSLGGGFNTNPKEGDWGFKGDVIYTESNDTASSVTTGTLALLKPTSFGLYGFTGVLSSFGGLSTWELGGVLQTNSDSFIGSVNAAYGEVNSSPIRVNFWTGSLEGAFYPRDNVSVSAFLGVTDFEGSGGTITTGGLGTEWQPEGSKASFFGEVSNYKVTGSANDIQLYRLGARWNFGSSLKARDAAGGIAPMGTRLVF